MVMHISQDVAISVGGTDRRAIFFMFSFLVLFAIFAAFVPLAIINIQ